MVKMKERMMGSHLETSSHYKVMCHKKESQTLLKQTVIGRTVQKSLRHRKNLLRYLFSVTL